MPGWLPRPALVLEKPLCEGSVDEVRRTRPCRAALARRPRAGLPRHHQDSSRRHSADPRRPRRAGLRQTGTGKTAAFALPTLQRLSRAECRVNGRGRKIRTLVLAPTRELALQICESFQAYGRHTAVRQAAIYGGVGQSPQVRALNQGVDVLIATPGPAAGPDAARLRGPVARRGADPRRGRPDARHGLYPRSAADHRQGSAAGGKRCCFPPRWPRPSARWPANG